MLRRQRLDRPAAGPKARERQQGAGQIQSDQTRGPFSASARRRGDGAATAHGDCVASREAAGDGATGGGAQSGPGAATAAAASGVGTEGGDGTMADFFLREPPRTFQILSRVCDVVALIRMALAHLDPHPFNELAASPREDVSDSS